MNARLPEAAPEPTPGAASSPPSASASAYQQQRTVWLLFIPLALLGGTRWVLQWMADRATGAPALPLQPFAGTQDPMAGLASAGYAVAALVLLVGGLIWVGRRWGGARVRGLLLAGWVVLGVAGSAGLVVRHLNVQGLQPQPPAAAEVLGSRPKKPSVRAAGGTLVVLRIAGWPQVQQVLIDDLAAAQWKPGQALRLDWATGRFSGRFVTGWQPVAPAGGV